MRPVVVEISLLKVAAAICRFICVVLLVSVLMFGSLAKGEAVSNSRLDDVNLDRHVFAHYMVCCPVDRGASLAGFKKEILAAQALGIDGFALNVGGWRKSEAHYSERVKQIYRAARELGTGFRLFISLDGRAILEVEDVVASVRDEPNQFRVEGRIVLSTFGGQGGDDNLSGRQLVSKIDSLFGLGDKRSILFVPYFFPRPDITELPQQKHVDQVFLDYPTLDGFFYFGAAGSTDSLTTSADLLARRWRGARKIFMSSVTPYYLGRGGNYRVFERRGFEGMLAQWLSAIRSDANWVQVVTWNDWAESSYTAPLSSSEWGSFWQGHFGVDRYPHEAYLKASEYFIKWFKTGRQPIIEADRAYFFYRPNLSTVDKIGLRAALPKHSESLVDSVYVTSFLTSPAQLEIDTGGSLTVLDLPQGVSSVSVKLNEGRLILRLVRNGVALSEKVATCEVKARGTVGGFNYFADTLLE